MSTNGVFVVLHEKQRGGSSGWGVCVRVLVNADERRGSSVQSVGRVWLRGVSRSGVPAQNARPAGAVMQEGSHVESGLANGK